MYIYSEHDNLNRGTPQSSSSYSSFWDLLLFLDFWMKSEVLNYRMYNLYIRMYNLYIKGLSYSFPYGFSSKFFTE